MPSELPRKMEEGLGPLCLAAIACRSVGFGFARLVTDSKRLGGERSFELFKTDEVVKSFILLLSIVLQRHVH